MKVLVEHIRSRGGVVDNRVYSPIGLRLGRNLPEEVALSIIAEVMLLMNGGGAGSIFEFHGGLKHNDNRNEEQSLAALRSLIDSIPCNLEVVDCLVGVHWVLVRSVGVGIAMTPPEGDRCLGLAGTMRGKGLHDCATSQIVELDGSRCWCGRDQFFFQLCRKRSPAAGSPSQCVGGGANIFDSILPAIKGRKVAVIGRFPNLEPLAAQCRLHILERRPQSGDFPDPACEYLLPSMDYVFITGSTFINKTLPRLLA